MALAGGAVSKEGHKYFPEIDGLRAIAVASVIVNHLYSAALPSGYLGVDVFFAISGYVITLSLLDRAHVPMREIISEFYVRRLKRLAPALVVLVLVGSAAVRLFDPAPTPSSITGILALFGLSNLFLHYLATDYFGQGVQLNPFSHTWSLGVEEQFYLFYPLMLMLGGHRGRFGRSFRFAAIALLSVASLAAFARVYGTNQPAAYFLLPFRFWEMGAGCMLAILSKSEHGAYRRWAERVPPIAPLVVLLGVFFLPPSTPVIATALSILCTLALLFSIRPQTTTYAVLTNRAVVYVGLLSYSLYLWHWIVICLSRWTIGVHLWTLPFQIPLMLALAAASFHLVEDPLRRRRWFARRWLTIVTLVSVLAVTAGVVALGQRRNLPAFSGSFAIDEVDRAAPVPGYRGKYSGREIDDCTLVKVYSSEPDTLRQHLARCTSTNAGRPNLVFVGDSHSMDLFPLAELVFKSGSASVTNVYQPGCRVPPVPGESAECANAILVLQGLKVDPGQKSVLVIRSNFSPKVADGSLALYARTLEPFLDSVEARGFQVIYVAPSPKYPSVGPGSLCSVQWFRPASALSETCKHGFVEARSEQLARRQEFTSYLLELRKRRPELLVFDPFDTLCGATGATCTPVRDGQLIYRNESHLTEEGSELLAPPFLQFLKDSGIIN